MEGEDEKREKNKTEMGWMARGSKSQKRPPEDSPGSPGTAESRGNGAKRIQHPGAETAIGLLSPVKPVKPVKLCGGIGQGHARPAFDVAAKWPVLALYDKQTRLRLKLRSRCVCAGGGWSMRAAMGQLPCAVFGCAVADRERNGQASNKRTKAGAP